jgi:hypothetical protein
LCAANLIGLGAAEGAMHPLFIGEILAVAIAVLIAGLWLA